MSFAPHVTVATIVTQPSANHETLYLFVKEHAEGRVVYNQPAGHLENNETLMQAAIRETLEETGCHIAIDALLGISHYVAPSNAQTYIRFTFIGTLLKQNLTAKLDQGIIAAQWLTKAQAIAKQDALRSPLILNDIARYEQGETLPLHTIYNHL
ncbi:NUDIX hydrolase [Marinagarivorans algicola]|uniref:NUDIX hydrolase n=1 Tax=Marinagarivorans algicola TaxID=1513270 RepID=UPI0006B5F182|nr:NUDIX hydrolase [Marinagarivorans algicola]